MNFEAVFRLLVEKFEKEKIRFALIGGFALNAAGFSRATGDIDFLAAKEDMLKVKAFLLSIGYELAYETEDVSTFISRLGELGRVDFLHAHRKYSLTMLSRAVERQILDGKVKLKVIIPEDLIGLKVQSSSNDPSRQFQDFADIGNVLKANREKLDMGLVREYFGLFGKEKELEDILGKIDAN